MADLRQTAPRRLPVQGATGRAAPAPSRTPIRGAGPVAIADPPQRLSGHNSFHARRGGALRIPRVLECFTAEKVARSARREQIAGLKVILGPECDPEENMAATLAANERFHMRLAELAANPRVIDHLLLSLGHVRRLDTLCTQSVPGWIGHGDIMSAIEAHKTRLRPTSDSSPHRLSQNLIDLRSKPELHQRPLRWLRSSR